MLLFLIVRRECTLSQTESAKSTTTASISQYLGLIFASQVRNVPPFCFKPALPKLASNLQHRAQKPSLSARSVLRYQQRASQKFESLQQRNMVETQAISRSLPS